MSTIIRIKGADFNNSNLPVIPRLVAGQLRFSYKPSTANGFVDSSGSSDVPSVIGSPTLNETGVSCGYEDGYKSQTTDSSVEFTAIAIYSEESEGTNFMPIGCYDSDTSTGWGINFRSADIVANCFNGSGSLKQAISDAEYDHEAQWVAMRISGDTMSLFVATNGGLVKTDTVGTFTDRSKDDSVNIGIGAAAVSSWPTGKDNVAEATFYQRALTDTEMQKAYDYSAAYFNKHTDLSI